MRRTSKTTAREQEAQGPEDDTIFTLKSSDNTASEMRTLTNLGRRNLLPYCYCSTERFSQVLKTYPFSFTHTNKPTYTDLSTEF